MRRFQGGEVDGRRGGQTCVRGRLSSGGDGGGRGRGHCGADPAGDRWGEARRPWGGGEASAASGEQNGKGGERGRKKTKKKKTGCAKGRRRSHGRVKPRELIVLPTNFFSPLILFRSKVEIQKFRSLNFVFV